MFSQPLRSLNERAFRAFSQNSFEFQSELIRLKLKMQTVALGEGSLLQEDRSTMRKNAAQFDWGGQWGSQTISGAAINMLTNWKNIFGKTHCRSPSSQVLQETPFLTAGKVFAETCMQIHFRRSSIKVSAQRLCFPNSDAFSALLCALESKPRFKFVNKLHFRDFNKTRRFLIHSKSTRSVTAAA